MSDVYYLLSDVYYLLRIFSFMSFHKVPVEIGLLYTLYFLLILPILSNPHFAICLFPVCQK